MRRKILFITLSLLTAALFVADIFLGSVNIPFGKVATFLTGGATDEITHTLLSGFRLPKAIVSALAGAALSASGLQMQTLFRNPLAGPYILGISSGASLGVAIFLLGVPVLGISTGIIRDLGVAGAAWIGAAVILALVFAASVRIKDIMAILILGMMTGSGAAAFVDLLQFLGPESMLKSFVIWTMGSLGGVTNDRLWILAISVGAGLLMSIALIKPLNLLLLGEPYARTMGQNVRRVRMFMFLSTTLLAGTVTAFCGPIGFIGTAVPHIARMVLRNADHKVLMPASMVTGAAVMLACDIVTELPGTSLALPLNTITAFVGIPVVIYVIIRNRKIY